MVDIKECTKHSNHDILTSEMVTAIWQAKLRKSPGPDSIPIEILKVMDDESVQMLTEYFNQIYQTGKFPIIGWSHSLLCCLKRIIPTNVRNSE